MHKLLAGTPIEVKRDKAADISSSRTVIVVDVTDGIQTKHTLNRTRTSPNFRIMVLFQESITVGLT